MVRGVLVVLALALAPGLAGCYVTHEPVLLGERYNCLCHYDSTTLAWSASATGLPDGGATTTGTVGAGTPERDLTVLIHPCNDTYIPAVEFCTLACPAWNRYPDGYIAGSGHYVVPEVTVPPTVTASHEGGGACDPQGTPPRVYIWPGVPPNAVRNGWIDTENSTVNIIVSDIGSELVEPESGYISGGSPLVHTSIMASTFDPNETVLDGTGRSTTSEGARSATSGTCRTRSAARGSG